MTDYELARLDEAQRRLYRRALDLAPPFTAEAKGLEVVYKDELLLLPQLRRLYPWSTRVKIAKVKLLDHCLMAKEDEPLRRILFEPNSNTPKSWPGTYLPGATRARGSWLRGAGPYRLGCY